LRNSPSRLLTALGFVACLLTGVSGSAQEASQSDGLNPFDPGASANAIVPSLIIAQEKTCGSCGGSKTSKPPSEDPPPGLKSGGGLKPPATGKKTGGSSSSCGGDMKDGGNTGSNTADDMRTRARDRSGKGMGYEEIGDDDQPPKGPQGPAIVNQSNQLSSMICKDGDIRFPDNVVKTAKWLLLDKKAKPNPKIDMKPAANGGYAIKGAEDFMKGVKTPPIVTPRTPYHMAVMHTADKIIKAGKRIADKNKKNIVDIKVKIFRVNVEVKCAKAQVCVKGSWKDAGLKPKEEPVETPASPRTMNFNNVLAKEIPQKLGKMRTAVRQTAAANKRYEADPCAGASSSSGGSSGGGGTKIAKPPKKPKRDCTPQKRAYDAKYKEYGKAIDDHAEAHLPILDLKVKKAKAELDKSNEKSAAETELKNAQTEQKNAKAALQRLLDNASSSTNPNFGDALNRAQGRADRADAAVKKAQGKLKAIDAKYKPIIDKINADLDKAQKRLEALAKLKAKLRAESDALLQIYLDCLAGK